MNLLSLLLSSLLTDSSVSALAKKTGLSATALKKLIPLAVPLLLKFLTSNASSESGAGVVEGSCEGEAGECEQSCESDAGECEQTCEPDAGECEQSYEPDAGECEQTCEPDPKWI